jgi:hypothetical protein
VTSAPGATDTARGTSTVSARRIDAALAVANNIKSVQSLAFMVCNLPQSWIATTSTFTAWGALPMPGPPL